MEFNWISKEHTGHKMTTDVKLSLCGQGRQALVTFSASAMNVKFNKAKFMTLAICGERIYFREAEEDDGYAVNRFSDTASGSIKLANADLIKWIHKHPDATIRNMRFDSVNHFYFIDAKEKDLRWA